MWYENIYDFCWWASQDITTGNSLAVQWLGLRAFTAEGQVRSLVGELRSHKPSGAAKKKNTETKTKTKKAITTQVNCPHSKLKDKLNFT